MEYLAVVCGRFFGAMLKEMGPEIIRIFREIFRNTMEDSNPDKSLVDRLHDKLPDSKNDIR
jgi:hypothetical protein